MTREIPLTQGKIALVDDEDYERVMQYKWYASKDEHRWYVLTHEPITHKHLRMHRLILNLKDEEICDHINLNGLDNRKCNLRIVTLSQNIMNRRKQTKPSSSYYKGVSWSKISKKWRSYIRINQQQYHLGLFINEEDAARNYDLKAKELFGEFARLNFP